MSDTPQVEWVENPLADDYRHPFAPGSRVRHAGEQYEEAEYGGTATILEIKGPFGHSWEYLVERDKPLLPGMDRQSWWASHTTRRPLWLSASVKGAISANE